jgi:hypothetical protein
MISHYRFTALSQNRSKLSTFTSLLHAGAGFLVGTSRWALRQPMRISDEDGSPFAIHSCDTTQLNPALLRLSATIDCWPVTNRRQANPVLADVHEIAQQR